MPFPPPTNTSTGHQGRKRALGEGLPCFRLLCLKSPCYKTLHGSEAAQPSSRHTPATPVFLQRAPSMQRETEKKGNQEQGGC